MIPATAAACSLDDGLGTRTPAGGRAWTEILTVTRELADHPATEPALRAAAARCATARVPVLARVDSVDRIDGALQVAAEAPDGIRLSTLLAGLEAGQQDMDDAAAFEVAATVAQALAAMHQVDPLLSHGAITPAHIIFTPDRGCMLTDVIFGRVFEALQRNRESLWRDFGVALPPSASAHRFDQRSDVTQLGAVVLAILLRRRLAPGEYPRGVAELVAAATSERVPNGSALRMWLQQALQLHPRAVFGSAVAASQALAEIAPVSGLRRTRRASAFSLITRPATMAATRCVTAP